MGGAFGPIAGLLIQFVNFVNGVLVPVVFALAFIVFLWGVYLYFFTMGADGKSQVKQGRSFILYGIIGFFVMVTIWGLVNILINSVGLDPRNNRPTPMFMAPYGPGIDNGFPGGGGGSQQGSVPLGGVCTTDAQCSVGNCLPDGTNTNTKRCSNL